LHAQLHAGCQRKRAGFCAARQMIGVRSTTLDKGFSLRKPMRAGQLFALLDATGFPTLADDLEASGLDHCSLFLGDDAVLLREEAPWLVALPAHAIGTWGELLRRGRNRHAGMLCVCNASLDDLRRHWKKWLSVHIPGEEALVLFRFFDARIALAFAATLGPADAQAFFGPNTALYMYKAPHQLTELSPGMPAPATRLGAGRLYVMTDAQMTVFSGVAADAFRARFRSYMRDIWPEETAALDDATLDSMSAHAITTAQMLDIPLQPDVIVTLAIIQMLAPEVIADGDFYLGQVRGKVASSGYPNILLMVATSTMPADRANVVVARAAYWTSYP
jgi:hypothetical protein